VGSALRVTTLNYLIRSHPSSYSSISPSFISGSPLIVSWTSFTLTIPAAIQSLRQMSAEKVGSCMLLWRWLRMIQPSEKICSTSTEVATKCDKLLSDRLSIFTHTRNRQVVPSHLRQPRVYVLMLHPPFDGIISGYRWHSKVAGHFTISRS
jgi:hypothetical protein